MKNPLTPAGIEPATSRFVAQHLSHCATAVPILACPTVITVAMSFIRPMHVSQWHARCNVAIGADGGGGGRGKRNRYRYKLPGPGPNDVTYGYVSIDSTIICRLHKLTLSDQPQVILQLWVCLPDLEQGFLDGPPLLVARSPGPEPPLGGPGYYVSHITWNIGPSTL